MFRRNNGRSNQSEAMLEADSGVVVAAEGVVEGYIRRAIAGAERRVAKAEERENKANRRATVSFVVLVLVLLLHFFSPPKLKLVPIVYDRNPDTGLTTRVGTLDVGHVDKASGLASAVVTAPQRLDQPLPLVKKDEMKWIRDVVSSTFTVLPTPLLEKEVIQQKVFPRVAGHTPARTRLIEWWKTGHDPIAESQAGGFTRVHDVAVAPTKDPHSYGVSWIVDHYPAGDAATSTRTERLTGTISVRQVALESQAQIDDNPEELQIWFWSIEPH